MKRRQMDRLKKEGMDALEMLGRAGFPARGM